MEKIPVKIALVVKEDPVPLEKADELAAWLAGKGIETLVKRATPPCPDVLAQTGGPPPPDLDCAVVLGGDGTFLHAARWLDTRAVPMLGVKFGTVGFLAETPQENLYPVLEAVLEGRYSMEPRSRLSVRVMDKDEEITRQQVLNDAVINSKTLARLADLPTHVDGHYLTTFRADGLIVATPTGSTAYSLAAGGPVVHPSVAATIITPICPHTLTNRPLIVPDSARVLIQVGLRSPGVMLTFDGQAGILLDSRHTVIVTRAKTPVLLIKAPGQHYFDALKNKLRWSGGKQ
jgi:NAD+ kinase